MKINTNAKYKVNFLVTLFLILFGMNSCQCQQKQNSPQNHLFENYRNWMSQFTKENDINGAAVALFDENKILWNNSFGSPDGSDDKEVNSETIFSIQSMSKTITATAVMIAVQKGLIDIDKPITEYLPDFTVNSCFEKNPQNKITMRHLLSHTAGFTHEAPVGNNYDASFPSYEGHCKSISDTWLKFPVGSRYSYSNLGYDLAAYILERVIKIPYQEFLEKELFNPLGMKLTAINPKKILENKNRAIGHSYGLSSLPAIMPLYGSGAIYTNINDLVKFVQLHINLGHYANGQLLKSAFLFEMYKPVIANYDDYALGIAFTKEGSSYAITHSGGGFGFGATMKWYPEYKIGVILLTNNTYCNAIYATASKISDDFILKNELVRDSTRSNINPFKNFEQLKTRSQAYENKIICLGDTVYKSSWNKYIGTYSLEFKGGYEFAWYAKFARSIGFYKQKIKVYKKNNNLYLKNSNEEVLIEYKPGLFFTQNGEALDFRSDVPRYRNIELEK